MRYILVWMHYAFASSIVILWLSLLRATMMTTRDQPNRTAVQVFLSDVFQSSLWTGVMLLALYSLNSCTRIW